ncbi:MAG: S-layer homology domain-containing protein, partial [Rikenellaceae bacterium]|nr:S-layer homology domain-containing protein [Rikenellaceae bacterium]
GMTATTFAPNAPIQRQQLCVMIVNFAKHQKIELTASEKAISFKDAAAIGNYAKDAVATCQMADIVNGYANGDAYGYLLGIRWRVDARK